MFRKLALGWLTALLAGVALAQAPPLATPPADARHFVIQSTGGKHGDSWIWVAPDGTRMGRETWNLRGQPWDWDITGKAGPDGMPVSLVIRGRSPSGDAAETFTASSGQGQWKSPVDAGSGPSAGRFYVSQGGPAETTAWFLERLVATPGRTMDLLPGGKARAEAAATLEVGQGAARQTVTLWSISGNSGSPIFAWTDAQGRFFATTSGLAWMPEAYIGEMKAMQAAQGAAAAKLAPGFVKALAKRPSGPVAFTHVRLFDADRVRFLTDRTVIVDRGVIRAVGPAARVKIPAGAQVIDGRGMTLSPGL